MRRHGRRNKPREMSTCPRDETEERSRSGSRHRKDRKTKGLRNNPTSQLGFGRTPEVSLPTTSHSHSPPLKRRERVGRKVVGIGWSDGHPPPRFADETPPHRKITSGHATTKPASFLSFVFQSFDDFFSS